MITVSILLFTLSGISMLVAAYYLGKMNGLEVALKIIRKGRIK